MKKVYPHRQGKAFLSGGLSVRFLPRSPLPGLLLVLVLLFSLTPALGAAPALTITGQVTDAGNGDPLPGVSIVVKGTSNGTTTDANGRYHLEVANEEAVLV